MENFDRSISVIIPVYNEERNVAPLTQELIPVLERLGREYEIIFIDDGSRDATLDRLKALHSEYAQFVVVCLAQNCGKAAAYEAGFAEASGDIILTMDGDLQDDPADMPALIEALDRGNDCVIGWKHEGKGTLSRALPSRFFNLLASVLMGTRFHDANCPFRAMRRACARRLELRGDLYRFIPLIARAKGFRVCERKVANRRRHSGRSKYGSGRFFKGLLDLLTVFFIIKFQKAPLHFFGAIGALSFITGFCIDLSLVINGLFITGRIGHSALLLMGVLLMLVGMQFFSIGLLGELISTMSGRRVARAPVASVIRARSASGRSGVLALK